MRVDFRASVARRTYARRLGCETYAFVAATLSPLNCHQLIFEQGQRLALSPAPSLLVRVLDFREKGSLCRT